jgi:vancomycin resistance protein YoaR
MPGSPCSARAPDPVGPTASIGLTLSAREGAARARVRHARASHTRQARLWAAGCVVAAAALGVGLDFAGHADRLARGIRIGGVPVGGLTRAQALGRLEGRTNRLQSVPLTFVAGGRRFRIRPEELGVRPSWQAAVDQALARGGGFAVVRGYRRLGLRLQPADYEPAVKAYDAAVAYEVGVLASKIDRPHVEARLVRHGLNVAVVRGRTGRLLDRAAATRIVVDSLAGFARRPVVLPVRTDPPTVTATDLVPSRRLVERILSAPVELHRGLAGVAVSRRQLARMLVLPREGLGQPVLGGRAANAYFARLDRKLARPARDASFVIDGPHVTIEPSQTGIAVDVPRTAASVLAAAERRTHRVARIQEAVVQPRRTTARAHAMGITGVVGSYETVFGGIPNRIHNVELVAHLVDGKLIAPGATFSFNQTTGARTAAKGFVAAPVIIDGELETGLGGGVCQVSTTVFNAAYEAGLPITQRTNHALYISHYPLGRDATVDYPGVDLKFVNDTPHWLLLRTFVTSSSLVVDLYGAPQHRRVVSDASPLRFVSPAPIERTVDKSLRPGERVIDDYGMPAQSTWVRRKVYAASGKLLSDSTWYSSYVAEPRIVRMGPPRKPKPKKPAKPAATATLPVATMH